MSRSVLSLVWLGIWAVGCGGTNRTPDGDGDGDVDVDVDVDADADGDQNCVDLDGDGYGTGDECTGDDCDDLDPELMDDCGSANNCADGVHVTGCPCDVEQKSACYTGPDGTGGVGHCHAGLRDCVDGVYQACLDQGLPSAETCNREDEDCDGEIDDGVLSVCGDCNFECTEESVGADADHPFDPDSPGARGVILLPDGSISLGNSVSIVNRVIWIANSGEGTVSKVDTTTNEELGRYRTSNGNGDPSRSTVNPRGDVVSVNRGASSATFIMASDCPDQDQDGVVTTSEGADDILAWEEDECMIWNLPITGGGARGAAIEERVELDGTVHEYAWIGAYFSSDMYEIDVEAGELTGREVNTSPTMPYGAALGPDHTLWITASGTNMCKLDTESLDLTQYTAPAGRSFYGITVDRDGYVWLSGWNGAQRFDPATEEYELVEGGCGGGIAADVDGNIWTGHGYICNPRGVARIDPETMEAHVVTTNGDTHGVAVDFDGNVWGINVNGGNAHKIYPDDESFEVAWTSGLNYNYTYSDMTGYQLVNATQELATYAHVFPGCDDETETTEWANLTWSADTPAGTSVTFSMRTADTLPELAAADLIPLASQPPDEPPVDIGAKLDEAGVTPGRYLEIEASLQSTVRDAASILHQFAVQHSCGVPFQ